MGLAKELSLAPEALRQALEEGKFKARVRPDFSVGVRSGVNGTPTFFINGKRHDGAFDYEILVLAIQEQTGKHGEGASGRDSSTCCKFLSPEQVSKWDSEIAKGKEFVGQKIEA